MSPRMAKIQNADTTKCYKDVEQKELSFLSAGMQKGSVTLEDNSAVSYKTKHTLSYELEIVLLGNCLTDLKSYAHPNICM